MNCVQHGAGSGCGLVGLKIAVCGCVFCGVVSDLVWPDLLWSGLGLDIGLSRNVLAQFWILGCWGWAVAALPPTFDHWASTSTYAFTFTSTSPFYFYFYFYLYYYFYVVYLYFYFYFYLYVNL